MKEKLKSYKFWISVLAGVIVLINTIGAVFKFSVNEVAITSIATAVLGLLVILGVVKKEDKTDEDNKQVEDKTSKIEQSFEDTNNKIEEKTEQLTKE